MCVVSMVGDHYRDLVPRRPWYDPVRIIRDSTTEKEIAEIKKELEEVKELLKKAKKYDEDNNEPECEIDEKVELLKRLSDKLDVDLSEVF